MAPGAPARYTTSTFRKLGDYKVMPHVLAIIIHVDALWNQLREEKPGSAIEDNVRESAMLLRVLKKERDD